MTLKIRIATRKSKLALQQVDIVKSYFGEEWANNFLHKFLFPLSNKT